MKLPLKLSRSKSSSANGSPLSSPSAPNTSTELNVARALSSNSLGTPKPAKGKLIQLRLPSLPRNRSRGSKCEITTTTSLEPSPKPLSAMSNTHAGQPLGGVVSSSGMKQEPLIEEIKRVFQKFDSNGDGKISADELQCVLRALGDNTTREEAELMVAEGDTDKDGFIDLQEFINLNMRGSGQTAPAVAEELAAAFNMFDLDRNGCISPDELHCVLSNLGNHSSTLEDCKRMIGKVDRKGCGYVDFDDFQIMMATSMA